MAGRQHTAGANVNCDAVGVWVNGQKARLAVGDGDISINNINARSNKDLYLDNVEGSCNTEMNGLPARPKAEVRATMLVGMP